MADVLKLIAGSELYNGQPYVLVDEGSEAEKLWRGRLYLTEIEEQEAHLKVQEVQRAEEERRRDKSRLPAEPAPAVPSEATPPPSPESSNTTAPAGVSEAASPSAEAAPAKRPGRPKKVAE